MDPPVLPDEEGVDAAPPELPPLFAPFTTTLM